MRPTVRSAAAPAAVLLVAGLVLTGCGPDGAARTSTSGGTTRLTEGLPAAQTESASPRPVPPSATEGPFGPDGPGASDSPDPALSDQPVPTLPPGDPGTDAPDDADSGTSTHPPVTEVPVGALLDVASVGAVAGGGWTDDVAPAGWCAAPRTVGGSVSRAALLTSDTGRLVETVSAHPSDPAAERAVARTVARLEACGWRDDRDPRLGEASEQLTRTTADGTEQVAVILASDAVGVVLVASGSAAAQGVWESLTDLALGSSCLAAADGCH